MTENRSGGFRGERRYHGKTSSSYHPYRSSNKRNYSGTSSSMASNRIVSVNEALKTDRVLSIESFANVERIKSQEDATVEYSKYVKSHQRTHLRNLFNLHKKEKWMINLINSSDSDSTVFLDKTSFNSITWNSETDLEYKDEYEMKLEESSIEGAFTSGTETRLSSSTELELSDSFSCLLPKFYNQIITMSNIPPHVGCEVLESHLKELAPECEIEITTPNPDKNFYRLAWTTANDSTSTLKMEELIPKLESLGSIEGAKIYFGIASTNFRRFKVTNYLKGAEEELFKLAIQIIKLFEKELFEDSNFNSPHLVTNLDKAVIYLRKVHNFCFYCATKFGCSQEMLVKCGDLHFRKSSESDQVKYDHHRLVEKISALIGFIEDLNEVSGGKCGNLDEALTDSSIKKVEEGKYRCNICSKAFKGPEFVMKHLMLKHEDVVLQHQAELEDFNKLLVNAQLWLFPSTMIPRYTKIRNTRNQYNSRDRDSPSAPVSHANGNPRLSKLSRNTKEYTDWDAAVNNNSSTEISYDLDI